VLGDAGTTFAAQHPAIDRMIAVAADIANLAAIEVDIDAAATGAHVACGLADLVGDERRGIDAVRFGRRPTVGKRLL